MRKLNLPGTISVIVLALMYFIIPVPEWLRDTSSPAIVRALTYPLFHANVFHLAANCLALYLTFAAKRKPDAYLLAVSFVISAVQVAIVPYPILGISNFIYAAIGIKTPEFSHPWWRSVPVITFLAVTLAMVFIPGISGTTHVVSFLLGCAAANFRRFRHRHADD